MDSLNDAQIKIMQALSPVYFKGLASLTRSAQLEQTEAICKSLVVLGYAEIARVAHSECFRLTEVGEARIA